MRKFACLMALLMLGGCNVVVTEQPLFSARDEAGAPPMKPGLWRMDADEACDFDPAKPLADWPECASGAVFAPGVISGHDKKDGKDVRIEAPFILAAGDPRVGQLRLVDEDIEGHGKANPPYGYVAVKPTKLDHGAIVEVTYWLVLCGPPPPPNAKTRSQKPALGTLHPLPGMKMKPGDAVCTTDSQAALRGAAAASRAWGEKPKRARWIRAGEG